jgi:hypothetical protein
MGCFAKSPRKGSAWLKDDGSESRNAISEAELSDAPCLQEAIPATSLKIRRPAQAQTGSFQRGIALSAIPMIDLSS